MIELQKSIKDQHQNLTALQQVLESELHLISSRDAEALITLLKTKEALLDSIQSQDKIIESIYLKTSPEEQQNEEIVSLLKHAQELVKQCEFRTKINQTAVEQGQLRLEHLRNILLESRAKESMTYDKSGKTRGRASGGSFSA
jgi:flagella synthesis protein FlgN